MSILTQNNTVNQLKNNVSCFFSKFRVGELLYRCNSTKEKGISPIKLLQYKVENIFNGQSMYMQQKLGCFKEDFSKNSLYRFLNNPRTNWEKFTVALSKKVADAIRPLTSESRVNAFIIDDSLFERTSGKCTELCSKVFDHTTHRYKLGYRLLTLGWTDGNTFIPINGTLLASPNDKNITCGSQTFDGRSVAAKRRKIARTKATQVMLEQLKSAMACGHTADYVLFDTWFSNPAQLIAVKNIGLDAIGMVKRSPKIHYEFDGKPMTLGEIYNKCKKRRGRSRYLVSVNVVVRKDFEQIPAKIVYVRNKNNRKDWIAIICTNPNLAEDEIIRIYGKRWQIEVFFKTCKSYLNLVKECRSLSYDALTAHVATVFVRYMFLALAQRENIDDRSLGEIFYMMCQELEDIKFSSALQLLMTVMLESLLDKFILTKDQLQDYVSEFIENLPLYIQRAILVC